MRRLVGQAILPAAGFRAGIKFRKMPPERRLQPGLAAPRDGLEVQVGLKRSSEPLQDLPARKNLIIL
jgi:hypothetical protein